jgi:SM-20-related protein
MSREYSDICEALAGRGWIVTTDFLPAETVEGLAEEARANLLAGRFTPAGVGRAGHLQIRPDVRSDQILWLDENELTPAQSRYRAEVESLRVALNRGLFLGLASFEAHFAFYPPGSFYRKHLDRFSNSDERAISCSLYLNSGWEEKDGGQLRLHLEGRRIEVFPRAGTFVIFRSDSVPHEVVVSGKGRFSVTGWFRRRSI